MATSQEVSARLMRSAKELSDWNFPLKKILEDYDTLLKQSAVDINYSEAALFLQNAANIYVQRIEYLFKEIILLLQTLAANEAAQEADKTRKKSKKTVIDFGDFEDVDFSKLTGTTNNINDRGVVNNSVKFLTQRFPQLEQLSRCTYPIEVYDVHGQVIGKKYDFRCNQYLTSSGILVEHLTQEDIDERFFDETFAIPSDIPENYNNASSRLEDSETEMEADVTRVESSQHREIESGELDDEHCGLDTSFGSFDSGVGSSIRCSNSSARPVSSLASDRDDNWDTTLSCRPSSGMSFSDSPPDSAYNSGAFDISEPNKNETIENSTLRESSITEDIENTETAIPSIRCAYKSGAFDTSEPNKNETIGNSIQRERSSVENIENTETAIPNIRRSKRKQNAIDSVNALSPKAWKPISFDNSSSKIDANSTKNQSEFKRPCPFDQQKPAKRKVLRKKRCPSKLLAEMSNKKMTMYSPTRQLLHSWKRENIDDLTAGSNIDGDCYEAVTNNSKDLLGFKKNVPKFARLLDRINISDLSEIIEHDEPECENRLRNSEPTNCEAVTNESRELLGFESPRTVPITNTTDVSEAMDDTAFDDANDEDFPMPETPESSGSPELVQTSSPPPTNYYSRIEQSVRNIHETTDVRTVQEEAVMRWHEYIAPKLIEVERRPPFELSQYTARVIEKIKVKEEQKIDFDEMVGRENPTEVGRLFLASLQLANQYVVEINTSDDPEGHISLTLLNKNRHSMQ